MRKCLFIALGSLLLMTGWGTASATSLITTGPNGVQGFLSITGFLPPVTPGNSKDPAFTMDWSNMGGSRGVEPAVLTFHDILTSSPIDLFSPSLDLKFDPSLPNGITDPKDPNYTPSKDTVKLQASWVGTAVVDPILLADGLTFGDSTNTNALVVGKSFTIDYTSFSLLGLSGGGAGELTFTIASATDRAVNFSVKETCITGPCFTQALAAIDAGTSKPGVIDGIFFVPEPTSWALLGIGLAGLGVTRRQKKAA